MPNMMGVKEQSVPYPINMGSMGTGWGMRSQFSPMSAMELFKQDLGNDPMALWRNLMAYYGRGPQMNPQSYLGQYGGYTAPGGQIAKSPGME